MKVLFRLRVILALVVTVLLPWEQAHCEMTPSHGSAATVKSGGHDHDNHGSRTEGSPAHAPSSPTDECGCACLQLPAAPAPPSPSLTAPDCTRGLLAITDAPTRSLNADGVSAGIAPEPGTGSPPGPSASPQSPRSPPHSA